MGDISKLNLPKTFAELAKLGDPVSFTEGLNPRSRPKLEKVKGRDYCHGGTAADGNELFCDRDPGTLACGYLNCVEVDPAKLKS